jgi:hypothetical protein
MLLETSWLCKIKDIRTKKIGQQKLSPTAVIRPGNKCKATYQNVKKVLSKRRFSHYQIYENQSKAVQGGQYQEVSINMRKIYRLQTTSKVSMFIEVKFRFYNVSSFLEKIFY